MFRSRSFFSPPFALALLATMSAAGAVRAEDRVVYQDTVVVQSTKTGARLPELATAATVVSPRELRLGSARTLHDALAPLPGVHVLDLNGGDGGGAVEARGFAAQGTTSPIVVMVDELPINDFETGRVDWSLLAQPQVDHIEFLRGPVSFLHGTAAMAGLVNLVTVPPGEGRNAWGQVGGGSEGRRNGAAGASWSGARAGASVSGSLQRLDGARANSAFRAASGYAFGRVTLGSRWNARARLLANDGAQHVPGPLPEPLWRLDPDRSDTPRDRRVTHAWDGALELRGPLAPKLDVTMQGSLRSDRMSATETIIPLPALDRESRVSGRRTEARLHWRPGHRALTDLLVGGEFRSGQLDSRYLDDARAEVGKGVVRRTSGGVFALARAPLAGPVTLVAGGRLDWLRSSLEQPLTGGPRGPNDDLRAASPTAGLHVALPHAGHAWASYAGAFKAPELEQAYDQRPYDFGFGPFLISNSAIQPQRGDHWDAGARTSVGSAAWATVSAYWARSRNEIGFDLANFRLSNIDRSRHAGLECELGTLPVRGVSGAFSIAWTRATFEGGEHDGNQINTVPEFQAFGRVSWEHRWHGSLSAEASFTGRQWIDEDQAYRLPDALVANLSGAQAAGPIEIFASVRNLADHRYASVGYVTVDSVGDPLPLYFPAAGRSFGAGVRWRGRLR